MSERETDYEGLQSKVISEYYAQINGRMCLSLKEFIELRNFVEARTNFECEEPTPEQLMWRIIYEGLEEQLRLASIKYRSHTHTQSARHWTASKRCNGSFRERRSEGGAKG